MRVSDLDGESKERWREERTDGVIGCMDDRWWRLRRGMEWTEKKKIWWIVGGRDGDGIEHEAGVSVCDSVCTCWSNVFEGPGPCWGRAKRVRVGVRERGCVNVRWQAGWRSRRSPVRGSSRSRWPRSRCGSDNEAYPPLHLWTLNGDTETQRHRKLFSVKMSHYLLCGCSLKWKKSIFILFPWVWVLTLCLPFIQACFYCSYTNIFRFLLHSMWPILNPLDIWLVIVKMHTEYNTDLLSFSKYLFKSERPQINLLYYQKTFVKEKGCESFWRLCGWCSKIPAWLLFPDVQFALELL